MKARSWLVALLLIVTGCAASDPALPPPDGSDEPVLEGLDFVVHQAPG